MDGAQLLSSLSAGQRKTFRKLFVSAILATVRFIIRLTPFSP